MNKFLSLIAAVSLAGASVSALAAAGAGPVSVDVDLDFQVCSDGNGEPANCPNWSYLSQDYGDVPGLLEVSHRSLGADLTPDPINTSLQYWADGYSGMTHIAFGAFGGIAEMTFKPGAGYQVAINSLTLGSFENVERTTSLYVLDAVTGFAFYSNPNFIVGADASSFNLGQYRSANGLILRWGPDAYNVGLDAISISVTAVPEPETWAMLLLGLGLIGTTARRRSRAR